MSMEDDLFNDQNTDMLDANDDDEEMEDAGNNNNDYDGLGEEEEEEEDNEEEDDENNGEEDDDEDDDDEEDEDDDDEEDEDDEDEDDEGSKFVDASETNQSESQVDANKDKDMMDSDEDEDSTDKNYQKDANRATSADEPEQENEKEEQDLSSSEPAPLREDIIAKAKAATGFDIVPSVAIPYSSQCHTLAFTDGPKWILTGGEDGFIRKYDFMASIEGKSPLTMAQRHNLVDSITKAGVISSYWENEHPLTKKQLMESNPKLKSSDFSTGSISYEPQVNPVYSLDVERNGYWCLSGLSSGGISLYTMRYNEGAIHHYFNHRQKKQKATLDNGHNDSVSVLKLNMEQNKFLSGSWDKSIREWDLNTGKCINLFAGSSGQISNIQYRPEGLTDLNLSYDDSEGIKPEERQENSDIDSLFGDSDNENNDKDRKNTEAQDKSNRSPKITNNTSKVTNKAFENNSVFMSSSIDGTINIWDVRASNTTSSPVLRLGVSEGIPPWCMSSTWSNCGEYIYAGRRNSTVEEFSIKMPHKRSTLGHNKDTMIPNVSKLLQFPKISGPVSAISTLPNSDFILCGSNDNIRLYNLNLYKDLSNTSTNTSKKPATPFMIIPGHHGGILSSLYVDETGRFMVSASGNRGWGHSNFTDTVLVYEIDFDN